MQGAFFPSQIVQIFQKKPASHPKDTEFFEEKSRKKSQREVAQIYQNLTTQKTVRSLFTTDLAPLKSNFCVRHCLFHSQIFSNSGLFATLL